MAEIDINGKKVIVKTPLAKRAKPAGRIQVAGVGQKGSNLSGSNDGVYISTEYYRNDISGKPYPGRINFNTQRVLAYNSTVVRAILTLRAHQVAKLPFKIIPSDEKEPPRQISILEYNVYDLEDHPAFDDAEKSFLRKVYEKLDPKYYISDKKGLFEEKKDEFTPAEIATIKHLQEKHDEFYRKRAHDIKEINSLLGDPDPWFTDTRSWGQLLKSIMTDLLILDRGIFVIIRDEEDKIRGLMPLDGSCYSSDTEVLTENGWKLFADTDIETDKFATRSKTGYFEWQKAFYRHDSYYSGHMYNFTSDSLDLLVSPNHRMLLVDNDKEKFLPAHEVSTTTTSLIPQTSMWGGEEIPTQTFISDGNKITISGKNFAALMGIYLARGSLRSSELIYISQERKDYSWQDYRLLYRVFPNVSKTGKYFVIKSKAMAQYLEDNVGIPKVILDATMDELSIFWNYYTAMNGSVKEVVTRNETLSDNLMELLQKLGKVPSVISNKASNRWVVTINPVRNTTFESDKTTYSDTIHCVSVPNETLYVRRNGKATWCGNTVRPLINEYGTYDNEKAYVQVIHGSPQVYFKKRDVVILKMNPMTDMKYFGYGLSNMETLYTDALADIFVDKGQLDFYRKGGSIPEGFISIEPMSSGGKDDVQAQINQETLETFRRHLESIMMGDYTQVPIISGGKVSYIDFKGRRRDQQYKELAEYLTRKICAVYQVSPQDVGITSNSNRSTSETQAEMTRSKGLETLMRVISEYVTQRVVNEMRIEHDLMLWFEDDDLDKKKIEWNIAQQKLVSGALSINQYRSSQGQHPVPWGNTPLQGLRNWEPEDKDEGGLPGFPGGLPPLPQLGGMENPGGPAGGDNPGAGGPPQPAKGSSPVGSPSNLKSSRFFTMKAATEEEAEDLMIKGFTEMYESTSNFIELHDIHNYPGGEWMRTPTESYEYFIKSHPSLGVTIKKVEEKKEDKDPFKFSSYEGNGVIEINEEGEAPLIRNIAQATVDGLTEDTLQSIAQVGGEDRVLESVELAVYTKLDTTLKSMLYEDFYKFKPTELTDAQIEKVGELLGL